VRLGKGTFAEVRKAVDVETGDMRAIKVRRPLDLAEDQQIIKHRFAGNAKTLNLFQREIAISQSLEHVSHHVTSTDPSPISVD
jgi:serine/threonine/tyrosine protein kinase RAD53